MLDVFEEMKAILRVLESSGVNYALCGGLAVSIYARPRATEDVDLLVAPRDLERCIAELKPLDYRERTTPLVLDRGKMEIRRLTKLQDDDFMVLDLLLALTAEQKQMLRERVPVETEGQRIWLVSVEGLKKLKLRRSSPQDLADIAALESVEQEEET